MRLTHLLFISCMALSFGHCAQNYSTQQTLDGKFLGNPAAYKKYPPLLLTPQTATLSLSQSVTLKASGGSETGYVYSVISGKGTITQAGVYTASDVPGNAVVEVKDSVGTNGHATISVNVDQKLPNTASGMKLWIKADNQPLLTNNGSASNPNVTDSSGGGGGLGPNTFVGTYLTNIYNGKPIIRYDAAFSSSSPATGTGFGFTTTTNSIILVLAVATTSHPSGAVFISSGTNATPKMHVNPFYWENQTATLTNSDGLALAPTSPGVLNVIVITQTDSVLLQAFQNGALVAEKVPVSPLNGKTIQTVGGTGTQYFGGDLAEIILYNRVLTNAENYAIQCGLAKKWGITMANCQ